jgi:hypothetical protein
MARFDVRSGSLAFARVRVRSLAPTETVANGQIERTGANGRERSLAFAMQKVVGSSPFIRLADASLRRGVLVANTHALQLVCACVRIAQPVVRSPMR